MQMYDSSSASVPSSPLVIVTAEIWFDVAVDGTGNVTDLMYRRVGTLSFSGEKFAPVSWHVSHVMPLESSAGMVWSMLYLERKRNPSTEWQREQDGSTRWSVSSSQCR